MSLNQSFISDFSEYSEDFVLVKNSYYFIRFQEIDFLVIIAQYLGFYSVA